MIENNLSNLCYLDTSENYELILSLFTKCNLNCDFCFELHSNDIDIEAIKNIPKLLGDNYPENLKNESLKNVIIGFLGGELFSDDIPDSMFDIYEKLVNDLKSLVRKYTPNVDINIDWVSNGVNTKHDRILKLLNNTNSARGFALSYDPIGRFRTKNEYDLFKNTFDYFYNKNIKIVITITLTKPNIDIFINNKDAFISNLPKDIEIEGSYYIANKNYELYQPSDDDLFNFYKWAIDNKFNINNINNLLNNTPVKKSCNEKYCTTYYMSKNGHCKFIKDRLIERISLEHYFGKYTKDVNDNNITEMKCKVGLEKRGCLYCEYKNICPAPCWVTHLTHEKPNNTKCFVYRIIKYLYQRKGL